MTLSANSELPHSLLKSIMPLSLSDGNSPGKLMPLTLMMSTRYIFADLTNLRGMSHPSSTCSHYCFLLLHLCLFVCGLHWKESLLSLQAWEPLWDRGALPSPPDVPVLGADSTPAKAIAWDGVAEGRHCIPTARNFVFSQGCCGEHTVIACS